MKKDKGFTLIETLLYLSLLSIILTGSLTTAYYLLEGAQKLENKISNNEERNFILNTTEWLTSGVSVINSPLGGQSGNSLSLNKIGFDKNPISLFQGAGKLYLKIGNDPALTLNTDRISVSNFTAQHISNPSGAGLILTLEINGQSFQIKKYLK